MRYSKLKFGLMKTNKLRELQKIAKEIENCKTCKAGKSGKAVPGEGSASAKIVFVGEAPGRNESLTGRPFIGRSGKLLRSTIRSIGLKEDKVYITSPVKYLPDKGTPSSSDIEHGRIHLIEQLRIIKPKIIVLMGAVACYGVLHEKIATLKMHGSVLLRDNLIYLITVHPSAAMRFPKVRKLFEKDFRKLKLLIDKNGINVQNQLR